MQLKKVKNITEIHPRLRSKKNVTNLLESNKLFIADYSVLDSIPLHGNFVFYSPQVLFQLSDEGALDLVAILLRSNKTKESHVVTKRSPPNKLLFAKMHVGVADSQVHENMYHFCVHFFMETIDIAANNHLSKNSNKVAVTYKPVSI